MRKNIHAIDWQKFRHAYGNASDVPSLILGLQSSDRKTREISQEKLQQTIWHQGDIYEATIYAIPFLIKALSDSNTNKEYIFLVLISIVNSKPNTWKKAAYEKVRSGCSVYAEFLVASDSGIRSCAASLLGVCRDIIVIPSLFHQLKREKDKIVKASIILALGELKAAEHLSYLESLLQSKEHEIKLAAAVALSTIRGEKTSLEILSILCDFLIGAESEFIDEYFSEVPETYFCGATDLVRKKMIELKKSSDTKAILQRLVKNLPKLPYYSVDIVLDVIFALLFTEKVIIGFSLSKFQVEILSIISETPNLWNDCGFTELRKEVFHKYGLPRAKDAEDFKNFLSEHRPKF